MRLRHRRYGTLRIERCNLVIQAARLLTNKALQTVRNAQDRIHVPNQVLIRAIDHYLRYIRSESQQANDSYSGDGTTGQRLKSPEASIKKSAELSLERTVEDMSVHSDVAAGQGRKSFAVLVA